MYTALVSEYLVIKSVNGQIEHRRGPNVEWHNRIMYESIRVEKLMQLASQQVLVVYSRTSDNDIERKIITGPCVYMPQPNEWLIICWSFILKISN